VDLVLVHENIRTGEASGESSESMRVFGTGYSDIQLIDGGRARTK